MIKQAAESVGVSRNCFYDWLHADPELEAAWKDAKESTIDFAEGKLLNNIKEGKETSIIFFLKTQGKKRGYVEKAETDINLNGKIILKVDESDLNL